MRKVTEQDLIDRGFKLNIGHEYHKIFKHPLFYQMSIITDFKNILLKMDSFTIMRPLTHDNLDLLIRFAEGRELLKTTKESVR